MGRGLPGVNYVGARLPNCRRAAGTAAFSDHVTNGDAHSGCVGNAPASAAIAADVALALVDAVHRNGFPLPAVKAKDAVGFCDRLPAF